MSTQVYYFNSPVQHSVLMRTNQVLDDFGTEIFPSGMALGMDNRPERREEVTHSPLDLPSILHAKRASAFSHSKSI